MAQILNPRCELQIFGNDTITINPRSQANSEDVYIDFNIDKDMDDESNEATLTIYNLSEVTRKKLVDTTNQQTPIEIYLTPYASTKHMLAFKGEIDRVKNRFDRPGHSTVIECTSQNENHRSFYFDRTYEAGVTIASIIEDMIDEINLPRGDIATLPTDKILFGESFDGPVFQILRRYTYDLGLYAYILDGKLHLTDLYELSSPSTFEVATAQLLTTPEDTTRIDRQRIAIRTAALFRNVADNARATKNRKKKKQIKRIGGSDYVEYEAVDKIIEGKDFEIFLQPDLNPDNIISYQDNQYRVMRVNHFGSNYAGDWTTVLETDLYT